MIAPLKEIVAELHADAERYERDGASVDGAKLCRRIAERLDVVRREWWTEILTLEAAAAERGVSYGTLQRKVAAGDLPNAGKKGTPRVRRCDLFRENGPDRPDLTGVVSRDRVAPGG